MAKVKLRNMSISLPCLVCGVDSGPIKTFLFVFIGGLVLCTISLLIWAIGSGHLRDEGNNGELAIKAENEKGR